MSRYKKQFQDETAKFNQRLLGLCLGTAAAIFVCGVGVGIYLL